MKREMDSIYTTENFKRSAYVKAYYFAFTFPEECKEINNQILTERFLKTKRTALASMRNNVGLCVLSSSFFAFPLLYCETRFKHKSFLEDTILFNKRQVLSLHLTNVADFPSRRSYDAATNPEKLFSQTGH